MRKGVLFIIAFLLKATIMQGQDFVNLFMDEHKSDSILKCITISPKMMKEILKSDQGKDEEMLDMIAELKSMQILRSDTLGQVYFNTATELITKEKDRFETIMTLNHPSRHCLVAIYKQDDELIEMILLLNENEQFTIINFTGNMSEHFIQKLKTMLQPKVA